MIDLASIGRYADPSARDQLAGSSPPRRALFLDRDGIINEDREYVHRAEQTVWVEGIFDLCRRAWSSGYLLVVVTNQAGIARGYYTEDEFLDYTRWVHMEFSRHGAPLLATLFCPHHPVAGKGALLQDCDCRKPKPGMLLAAAYDFDIDLRCSLMIGDSPSDMEAAARAGLKDYLLVTDGNLESATRLFLDDHNAIAKQG